MAMTKPNASAISAAPPHRNHHGELTTGACTLTSGRRKSASETANASLTKKLIGDEEATSLPVASLTVTYAVWRPSASLSLKSYVQWPSASADVVTTIGR